MEENEEMTWVENPIVKENEKYTWKHLACHGIRLWAVTNNINKCKIIIETFGVIINYNSKDYLIKDKGK